MRNKNIIWISLVFLFVFIGLGYIVYNSQAKSIITPIGTVNTIDGKEYYVSSLNIFEAQQQGVQFTTVLGEKKSILFNAQDNKCKYTLVKVKEGFYELQEPEAVVNIGITYEGKKEILDGTIQNEKVSFDNSRVIVQTQGILSGKSYCASPSGVAIYQFKKSIYCYTVPWLYPACKIEENTPLLANRDVLTTDGMFMDIKRYAQYPTPQMVSSFTEYPNINLINYEMNGKKSLNSLGSGLLTVGASTEFFYKEPEKVEFDFSTSPPFDISSGKTGTILVTLINKKPSVCGTVSVTVSAPTLSFGVSNKQVDICKNPNIYFSFSSGVTKGSNSIKVLACGSGSQFEQEDCITKNIGYTIKDNVPDKCGDSVCDPSIGENSATCSKDCPDDVDCKDILNSHLENGVCVCDKDYKTTFDEDNKMICEKPTDWLFWGIAGFIALFITMLIAVLVGKKR